VDALAELRAIYKEVDAVLDGFTCDASSDCCHFARTGREPYPSAIEIAELARAVRARGGAPKKSKRALAMADERRCVLLGEDGKCSVYASRPFGCRTFFCERGHGPVGEAPPPLKGGDLGRLGRAIADLSARFDPHDPGPRPLSKVTARPGWESRGR